jgi:phage tail-like protein
MIDITDKILYDYPPAAFHFNVVFSGLTDHSFQDVSGIESTLECETVKEGGENRFAHRVPLSVKHQNLVLKRGIAPIDSPLVIWCKSVLEGDFSKPVKPRLINVHLLNENHMPLRAWSFENAYPVKWEVEAFGAQENKAAIEKIEFCYTYSTRIV